MREVLEDLRKVRFSKINAGLQVLQGPMTVKLNNLAAMECNVIRAFFQGALDRFHLLSQVRDSDTPDGARLMNSSCEHMLPPMYRITCTLVLCQQMLPGAATAEADTLDPA